MDSKKLKLDHFLIYNVPNEEVRRKVSLKGLFDLAPVNGEIVYLDLFANPVTKDGEPVLDLEAHFTMYNLFSPDEPMRAVWVENQFSGLAEQKWYLGNPFYLMAPAHKYDREPSPSKLPSFPDNLDHYKVYRVLDTAGDSVDREVKLKDQFGRYQVAVGAPVAYAVPVEKEHERKRYPIIKEQPHLTIYRLSPKSFPKTFWASDQFVGRRLGPAVRMVWLAVPAICRKWEAVKAE
jgi:hypothetical protein